MGDCLDRALSATNLDTAWRALAGDRADWRPGLPRERMEQHRLRHQLELVNDVHAGRYRADGMRQFTVSKADGGQRVLSALYLRDKFLQRAVTQALDRIGEHVFHNDSFGYRRGRGVPHALARCAERIRCGLPWLVDGDICRFFDRIPHADLLKRVQTVVNDRAITALIQHWLLCGTYSGGILQRRRGIPQGAVISPFLCNLYLHQLDCEWERQGIPFVRYADDFLLFLPDRALAERALAFTAGRLRKLGLELHPEKTQVAQASRSIVFLGASLKAPRS